MSKINYEIVKKWETKAGLKAVVILARYGTHHCGYVEAPSNLVGIDYEDLEEHVEVHGGITYSGRAYFNPTIPWVFGYDCAHAGDEMRGPYAKYKCDGDVWRDEDYCIEQCESLAKQLMHIAATDAQLACEQANTMLENIRVYGTIDKPKS